MDVFRSALLPQNQYGMACLFERLPNSFAKWRWGTLYKSAVDLRIRSVGLFCLDIPALFPEQGPLLEEFALVFDGSPGASEFWDRLLVGVLLLGPLEKLRAWALVCSCPDHVALRAAGKSVQCNLNGRRLGEALARIQAFQDEMTTLMTSVGQDHPFLVARGWLPAFQEACAAIRGRVALKFVFLKHLPYLLVQALWSREAANACVVEYQALLAQGRRPDRISFRHLDPLAPLSSSFMTWRDHGVMCKTLSLSLRKYAWGKVDESAVEGNIAAFRSSIIGVTHPATRMWLPPIVCSKISMTYRKHSMGTSRRGVSLKSAGRLGNKLLASHWHIAPSVSGAWGLLCVVCLVVRCTHALIDLGSLRARTHAHCRVFSVTDRKRLLVSWTNEGFLTST